MKKNAYHTTEHDDFGGFSKKALSYEEEIELSKRILAGESAKRKLAERNPLRENERISLEGLVQSGEEAYEQLVLANIPRAMKFAIEAHRKNPHGLNDLEDYRQTAMKVICVCARTYDWRNGCRFGTYVHHSLKNEMLRENARTGYALRIPEEDLCRLNNLKNRKDAGGSDGMTEKGCRADEKLLALSQVSKSLEEPLSRDEEDAEFGETIADPNALTAEMIEEDIAVDLQISRLIEALEALPENEKALLRGRMGFDGDPEPLKAFVGTYAQSISGVQKRQIAAEKHLREIYFSLPEGRLDFLKGYANRSQGEKAPLNRLRYRRSVFAPSAGKDRGIRCVSMEPRAA